MNDPMFEPEKCDALFHAHSMAQGAMPVTTMPAIANGVETAAIISEVAGGEIFGNKMADCRVGIIHGVEACKRVRKSL
jgi:hypothetical protein